TDFFPAFRPIFKRATPKVTNAEARFMIEHLKLRKGSRLLDCPCGIGRLSIPLARKGIRVTAVDITRSYLEELQKGTDRAGLPIDIHHADMRRIRFKKEFDAAANVWTSFGFFETESDNELVLKKLYDALKPGGRCYLSLVNRDWVIAHYSETDWFDCGDLKVLQRRHFDYATSLNYDVWTFIKDGKQVDRDVTIRAYSCHELFAMFRRVGFEEIEAYGSLKGEPVDRNRQMMYFVATKPGGKRKTANAKKRV
ncbi:MAG TPA: class I SAM-dependent methyltransferase, partial [candidate division Zixibacteria bacterium]|nr:class I SAM-dependent methyltransferase [candidate division Zixibacteria bacterium]